MIYHLHHKAPNIGVNRVLLIMLPGVGIEAAEFAENGMVAAAQAHQPSADIIAVHPDLELYLDSRIASALHSDIVEPALAQGHARIWLLGISLGGMGALLYASAHAAQVEGIILLAPFLGTRGTIAEVAQAGGLASWSPTASIATDQECRILLWLQNFLTQRPAAPALYLGYGQQDRFAQGHRLLAEHLPVANVVTTEGGHDWNTWATLWRRVLNQTPFAATAK